MTSTDVTSTDVMWSDVIVNDLSPSDVSTNDEGDGVEATSLPELDAVSGSGQLFAPPTPREVELDGMERDLADVETALARLDAGSYWTCEVSGAPLPDELLARRPTARRAAAP